MTEPANAPKTTQGGGTSLTTAMWLEAVATVIPPKGVLLVGAGNGTGPFVQWLKQHPTNALLVEGDASQYQHLQRSIGPESTLELVRDVVAATPEATTFYRYNNPAENGLLPAQALRHLWPQLLETGQTAEPDPVTIDQLVDQSAPQANWLILDCLPSATLLEGAQQTLKRFDVVICRTATGADSEVQVSLEPNLRVAQYFSERHPHIGHTVWVRDVVKQGAALDIETAEKNSAIQQRDELAQAKTQLAQQLALLQEQQAQLQQQLQAETQARLAEAQAREAEASAKTSALQERDALAQAKTQLAQHLALLQEQQAQLQQQLQAETQARLAEAQAREAEASAKTSALQERDGLVSAKAELTHGLASLQQKLEAETQARQNEAVAKTDAFKQRDEQANAFLQSTKDAQQANKRAAGLQKQVDSAMARVAKLQLKLQATQAEHARALSPHTSGATTSGFKLTCTTEFNLGEAWAGNTVNTVIFRHHGIFTHQGHQFSSFYVDERTLRFVSRRLSDDQITQYDLAGEYNLKDAHNSISMGVDRDGYLHVCFDHHASKLRYRRSLLPMNIEGWTDDQLMTGQHEDKVTYPTFILPRAGYPLTLLYRDGIHNKGCARLKYYDELTTSWKDKPTPILSGADQKPWTSNAYWNHPAIGSDGSLHLSFVWRTGVLGDEQLVNNINIGYAWSPDNGHHWYTLHGQPYQVPITPTTAETIWPAPPGSNLINQCSMALDAYDRPHIVFYANDADGIPQYQHLRYDGKTWCHQRLSQRTQAFNLTGGGTLQIPISRPDVLMDTEGNALIIYRGDLTSDNMTVTRLSAPHYQVADSTQLVLNVDPLGHAEPVIDREGWKLNNKLSILLQHNRQPNHDENITMATAPVRLCEFEL